MWGGYDAVYHFGRRVDPMYEDRLEVFRRLAALLHHLPAARGRPVQPPLGRRHRHQHAVLCALGLAGRGRIAYVNGFTGLGWVRPGSPPMYVSICSTGGRPSAPGWRWFAASRCRSRRAVRQHRHPGDRWSLDRTDHNAGERNVFLRVLDKLGLGFDS